MSDGKLVVDIPAALHPKTTALVLAFSTALAEKLLAAQVKYGYSDGWADPSWMEQCRAHLRDHVRKGDPRDVAAYCAFLWHHGETTALPPALGAGKLAVMDKIVGILRAGEVPSLGDELAEARDGLSELIESDKEYDAAFHDWDAATSGDPMGLSSERWEEVANRFEDAVMRRIGALNSIGGGA